ncbi:MAG TPA: hypothetical protein VMH37_12805 [Candidatus Binataceae bacterium]|nr:hypothetical protein [Candidatus Binataceae bacterium]
MTRSAFAKSLAAANLEQVEVAVGFLWYYVDAKEHSEKTPSELAQDMHDEGFARPNVTRLRNSLVKSPETARGKKPGSFQLNLSKISILDQRYSRFAGPPTVEPVGEVLPPPLLIRVTRAYLKKMVHQINASYEFALYDGAGVLMRRLMESLIIEVYIHGNRADDIKVEGNFLELAKLIAHIKADPRLHLARGACKTMDGIKFLGDTAAHHRTYITQKQDLDDLKSEYRKLIAELMNLADIG